MKSTFVLVLGLFAAMTASAVAPKIIVDAKAVVNVCSKQMMGCAHSITVKNVKYKISYDAKSNADGGLQKLMGMIIGNNQFHNQRQSQAFAVEGYVAKEKGHFPNPTVEFTVFKITALSNVVLPRGL